MVNQYMLGVAIAANGETPYGSIPCQASSEEGVTTIPKGSSFTVKSRVAKCHTLVNNMESKHFGAFEIIGKGSKYNYYQVRFSDTGSVDEFRLDAILRGEIRDKYAVTFCGIGVIGNIPTKREYRRYYETWRNMITRCYRLGNNPAYYGHVTVAERWHTFEYFYADVDKIDGWNKDAFERGE